MIRATLIPPSISPELALESVRELMRQGRATLAQERKEGREKAHRYASYMRNRSRVQGRQEGLLAAGSQITGVIEGLRSTYDDAIDQAHEDMHAAARAIAEQVIPRRLLSDPQIFEHWVNEALVLLKRSKTLHIVYHPQYHDILQLLAKNLPASITLAPDHNLEGCEFAVTGESGGIEFSWKSSLDRAEQQKQSLGSSA